MIAPLNRDVMSWEMVDEGWGRRAVEFATLNEPANCREYVTMHHRLGVGEGDRLLDVACGSGLAIELARARGAACAGIDASQRLIAVALDRNPDSDIRVGDMQALPWGNETFDVVTGFRGIWGTTPEAVDEAHRVLVPGGRLAIAVWGNVGKSPGAWMMAPFLWATDEKVQHQETCARGLASTGPAYEAIQSIGEEEFITRAIELAARHMRDGLPLRGQIELFGYLGTKR